MKAEQRTLALTIRGWLAFAGLMLALGAGLTIALASATDWFRSPQLSPRVGQSPPAEPAPLASYAAVIRPLFDAKCAQCHGEKKQKAGLSLATPERILAGGKHGPPIDRAAPEKSLMLARIQLAQDAEKHMPPEEEEQLAPQELAALQRWILAGAPFEGVVAGIDAPVAAPEVSDATAATTTAVAPTLAPADPQALAALRAALVHAQPVSEGSPLLWIDFAAAARAFDDAKVAELLAPLRVQAREISLARSAVGDATLTRLAEFDALRRLDVRATEIGDAGIAELARHGELAELVLSQNKLTDASVDHLIAMPALRSVHLWRSGISPEGIARLRAARPELRIDDGSEAASIALEAETTIALTKAPPQTPVPVSSTASPSLVPINMKCPVTGAPVNLKYVVVHEGKVIGFCCPDCPKQFWADPAKFADRLQ